MKETKGIRQRLGKLGKGAKDQGLREVIEDLVGLYEGLAGRVERLEAGEKALPSPRPARRGTPGMRKEVERDVAGKITGEPKRTERPTGRNSRVETDMDRGII